MSKIVGFQITENKKWETTNEKTGEVRSGVTNRVTFHCEVKLKGDDAEVHGNRGKSYIADIKDLPRIFGQSRPLDVKLKDWLIGFCDRRCILETSARTYGDNFSGEELVLAYFPPENDEPVKK